MVSVGRFESTMRSACSTGWRPPSTSVRLALNPSFWSRSTNHSALRRTSARCSGSALTLGILSSSKRSASDWATPAFAALNAFSSISFSPLSVDGLRFGQETCRAVTPPKVGELWLLLEAAIEGMRATGVEAAAARRAGGVGHVAFDGGTATVALDGRVGHRDDREQRLRVGVLRIRVQRVAVGDLDELAEVHDRDPRAHVPDDAQVMADEDVGEVVLVLQPAHQLSDGRRARARAMLTRCLWPPLS